MRHARHVRRSKRTPSRAEQLARNMKRRGEVRSPETEPAPTATAPTPISEDAPYDPVTVPIRSLAEALAEIDDAEAIEALQSSDPRSSATQHYEARLKELADG